MVGHRERDQHGHHCHQREADQRVGRPELADRTAAAQGQQTGQECVNNGQPAQNRARTSV